MLIEQLITQQELQESLTRGVTVLTGNNRLANTLIEQFDQYNISNNKMAWSSPNIIPLNSWLIKNWEEAILSGVVPLDKILLSSEQEFQVWETIIKESSYGNGLLRISATAKSVSEAWHLLQNWNLTRNNTDYQNSDDARAFHYWSTEFEKRCDKENWIVASQLASLDFYSGIINTNEIFLMGFEELSPQLKTLFDENVKWLRLDHKGNVAIRLQCDDVRNEIELFSYWAKQRLEENSSNRIGLVVPNISSIRPVLLRTLERVLIPSVSVSQLISRNADSTKLTEKPWDISMGLPLADFSIIKLAFQLFSIVRGKMTIETVSSLLRSPHIVGATEELNQRALLDRQIRESGEPFISLQTLLFYSSHDDKSYCCPILSELVTQLIEFRKSCPDKTNSQQWLIWLGQWLTNAGWGTGRSLSSEEYQTIEAWKNILQSFTSLQVVTSKMIFEDVIVCLHRLASEKIFQIQTKSAPIQILGLYESIGLEFDHLWVMNLYDEIWPVSPRPNPFIPVQVQKKHQLPHASWERELLIAKKITKRLENSASNVVFSYPAKNGAHELRSSPLICEYKKVTKHDLAIEPSLSWQELIKINSKQETLDTDTVATVGSEKISGGSSIFKNQSLCPFRALVENRLHAKPMRKTQSGLDAMKRGTLLHDVLDRFWTTITTQQQLISKTKQELELTIKQCIDEAITEMVRNSPDTFSDCFTRIEKQRLLQLVLSWLELEKLRASFKVIDTEREENINVNGVRAHLYIDRIDELENGQQIIIDYKTGIVSPTDWFGERPNDPQLPLYSINFEDNLSAVLFAQIKTGNIKFNGVVEQADIIPNLPPTTKSALKEATEQWPQVLNDWSVVLNSLANDFMNSHTEVDPKEGTTTCRKLYCELSSVCRINELIKNNDLGSNTDFEEDVQ